MKQLCGLFLLLASAFSASISTIRPQSDEATLKPEQYTVSIRSKGDLHICSGALIAPTVILTHRICSGSQRYNPYSVILMPQSTTDSVGTPIERKISEIKAHDSANFLTITVHNNVAIIKVSTCLLHLQNLSISTLAVMVFLLFRYQLNESIPIGQNTGKPIKIATKNPSIGAECIVSGRDRDYVS